MYDGDVIRVLLAQQKKSQKDLSMAVTGRPNSSLHNLFKNPTVSTLEKIADFFGVTMDTFFQRKVEFDATRAQDIELAHLRQLIEYYKDSASAQAMYAHTNDALMDQLKHRVAELEHVIKTIHAHPEMAEELSDIPQEPLIVPYMQGIDGVKALSLMTPAERKKARTHKKLMKMVDEKIRKGY